jgi:Fur family ferric uptake transcriptional regulator
MPLRQSISIKVQKSLNPINAQVIHQRVGKDFSFSTIYRGLHYLEKNGYIEGFSIMCDPCVKDRFFIDTSRGHVHFFHCEKCHSFIEAGDCALNISGI